VFKEPFLEGNHYC